MSKGNRIDKDDKVNNEVLWIDELSVTNQNRIEIVSYNDYYNIYNVLGKEILFIE